MAITRLAISNPAANTDTLMHTAVRSAVASVIATNKDTVSSIISVWIVPSGQDATPANWVHIASNLSIEAGNSVETFRFPIVGSDKIYIRSSTANVSFSLNALYESNGTSNITAQSTAPASPQIGDVWVDTDDNKVYFWSGTAWVDAVTELPSQSGNNGKYLTTNGTSVSWGTIDLSAKADLASPTFTGTPAAPTASVDTNTTQIATTAFVVGQGYLKSSSAASTYAPLSSPSLSGTPTAPTAAAATNTTQIATTAFVRTEISNLVASAPAALDTLDELAQALGDDANFATTVTNSLSSKAPLASPTFTGTVILPSATSIGDISSTEIGYLDGVTSSIQTQLNSKSNSLLTINNQSTSYTLVLSDGDKLIEMNSGSAQTLTIPLDSSVAFPNGTKIDIVQTGAGECSISPTSGVTLNSDGNKRKINAQWAAASLIKRSSNNWVLVGALKS